MSDIILNDIGDVQRFITNAPVVLTNSSGISIKYKMSPWYERDVETLEDSATVTVPPGMMVEFYPDLLTAATVVEPAVYTTTEFSDIEHAINTTDKYTGKFVWDVTTGAPVWASGSAAGDVWVDSAAVTVYTPV